MQDQAVGAAAGGIGLIGYVVIGTIALMALIVFLGSFFIVEQQTAAVVERLGKFVRIAQPGLNFKLPIIDSVRRRISLRIEQLKVEVETKTRDNVFVSIDVVVQYQVIEAKVKEAAYQLANPAAQITAYVEDVVRAHVPKMTLDEVFVEKDTVATAVKSELASSMDDYGYLIVKALVVDIDPDEKVQDAMNEINAATRLREAATQKAEGDKILAVKAAEAESESKRLQGEGIAAQRLAIAKGIETSLEILKKAGVDPAEATAMMLMTQYLDTLHAVGANSRTNVIMIPHSPGAIGDLQAGILAALEATKSGEVPPTKKNGAGDTAATA